MNNRISRFVISTWVEKKQEYKVLETFDSKLAARIEYYAKIGRGEYSSLFLIDAEKGKTISRWVRKDK